MDRSLAQRLDQKRELFRSMMRTFKADAECGGLTNTANNKKARVPSSRCLDLCKGKTGCVDVCGEVQDMICDGTPAVAAVAQDNTAAAAAAASAAATNAVRDAVRGAIE